MGFLPIICRSSFADPHWLIRDLRNPISEPHLLTPRLNLAPQFSASIASFGRVGKQSVNAMVAGERRKRVAQFVAGKLVGLGGYYQKVAAHAAQEINQVAVRRLRGNVGINQ